MPDERDDKATPETEESEIRKATLDDLSPPQDVDPKGGAWRTPDPNEPS